MRSENFGKNWGSNWVSVSILFLFLLLFLLLSFSFFFPFPPIPFLFLFSPFVFLSFSPFSFLFLSLSFSSPFPMLSFPFLYPSFSLSSLMWILWSRCEASAWKNDKRKNNDNVWQKHLKGLGGFTRPRMETIFHLPYFNCRVVHLVAASQIPIQECLNMFKHKV